MTLNCLIGSKYQPLCESLTSLDLHVNTLRDIKQAEVTFYNENNSFTTVIVEENLRACDLCQLLALKNQVPKDVNWSLVEHDTENGLERCLEDHEEVLKVYISWGQDENKSDNKFYFRKTFHRYEFFDNPQLFLAEVDSSDQQEFDNFKNILLSPQDDDLQLYTQLWQREGNKEVWKKAPCLLTNGCLYHSINGVDKTDQVPQCLADLHHYSIHTLVNVKKNYKIPTQYCFCLKPTNVSSATEKNILYFCCETCKSRRVWIAALRVAKYGKQLRENYQIFKQRKHVETNGTTLCSGSARSRVAMDFTGNYGKIVNDPKEAEAVAKAEGHDWNKKLRIVRRPSGNCLRGLEFGVHMSQPWFYGSLSREETVRLLMKEPLTDGTFLVRESHSSSGSFVLSFVHGEKIYHTQIVPIQEDDKVVYSLDNGATKFYDILQLIEFYQLNGGSLPMKLTHYVVPLVNLQMFKETIHHGF